MSSNPRTRSRPPGASARGADLALRLLAGLGDDLLELIADNERRATVFGREPLDAIQDIREKRDCTQASTRLDADRDGDLAVRRIERKARLQRHEELLGDGLRPVEADEYKLVNG